MPQNFIAVDREQSFLLPPSLRDWLPADHLARYMIDAVAQMDLTAFYADYRDDGHGRAAYEPSMMVAVILDAFATKQRSSRGIERHCRQDIAYRVITGNLIPDYATIARFIDRHEQALAGSFGEVLALRAKTGLVKVGVIAIDGTKVQANANRDRTVDFERIAREIIAEAKATDEAEDEPYGEARGDEPPEQLRTPEGRRRALREAKQRLEAEREAQRNGDERPADEDPELEFDLDRERLASNQQGRRGWMRDARRQLDELRKREARPIPARGRSACWRPSGGSRKTSRPNGRPTGPMSITGLPRATGGAGGSVARRTHTRRLSSGPPR
jgi:transposase